MTGGPLRLVRDVAVVLTLAAALLPAQERIVWDRERDAVIERVRELDAMIAAAKDWSAVAARAQALLDSAELDEGGDRVVPLNPDVGAEGVWFPVTEYVTRRLVSLPPAGLAHYRDAFGPAARDEVDAAVAWQDADTLADAAARFRATAAGERALRHLAEAALERGRFRRAARHFDDLLEVLWRAPDDDPRVAGAAAGRLLAGALAGERPPAHVAARAVRETWRPRGVTAAPGPAAGPTGDLETVWTSKHDGGEEATGGLRPWTCIADDRAVYHTRTYARALELRTGATLWTRPFDEDGDGLRRIDSIPSLRGACDGRRYVFATRYRDAGIERSELVCLSVEDGRTLWRRPAAPAPEEDEQGALWDAAPLLLGEAVLVTAIDPGEVCSSWVVRLDASDGRVAWRARVGGGLPLPYRGDDGEDHPARYWIGCSPMAEEGGLVFVCDNLGTLACLEAETGRPRWCYRYPRRRVDGSGAFDTGALPRGWDFEPLLVERGVLAAAPDDADALHVLFVRPPQDARRRAEGADYLRADSIPREGMRQLIGFDDGEIYVAGRSVLAVGSVVRKLTPLGTDRLEPWDAPAPLEGPVVGRANLGQKRVYVCSPRYVYAIDRGSGLGPPPLLAPEDRGRVELGNPVPTPHGLVVAGLDAVRLHRGAVHER